MFHVTTALHHASVNPYSDTSPNLVFLISLRARRVYHKETNAERKVRTGNGVKKGARVEVTNSIKQNPS
jgi:hypothetical protein